MVTRDELYGIFQRFKTDIFIETGSHMGFGIERALDIGYKEIFSIEIQKQYFDYCRKRFKDNANVIHFLGPSIECLPVILDGLMDRATFWLDAHMSGSCPVLSELTQIAKHPVKNHNILIDDMRDFGTKEHNYITINDLICAIRAINPAYEFERLSTGVPNNVLAAYIDE